MKAIANLLISLILAGWMAAIAILVIQNFSPISLKFLTVQSFQMPVGVVLSFSLGTGLVGAAIVLPLLGKTSGGLSDLDDA